MYSEAFFFDFVNRNTEHYVKIQFQMLKFFQLKI